MTLPNLDTAEQLALFLDFDGTIVAIADRPDEVRLEPETREALEMLHHLLDGAVAIVTGRDIAVLDGFLAPLHLPVAGVHGSIRRDAGGKVHAREDDGRLVAAVESRVRELMASYSGLLLERKHGSVALHYRAHPEIEAECLSLMQAAVDSIDDAVLKRGKMVVEAKSLPGDKGSAIAAFMAEAPFKGRRPVFAGDDVTDEDAFSVVNAMGGVTIKIGTGVTAAAWRAASTDDFLAWLRALPHRLGSRGSSEGAG